jgi:hypothetical protein
MIHNSAIMIMEIILHLRVFFSGEQINVYSIAFVKSSLNFGSLLLQAILKTIY